MVDGEPFLSSGWGIGLMINVDWFQPYKHTTCSVGAIILFLTIMNLLRYLRYKRQNVILVGMLPGLHEPHHDIYEYINPLVHELKFLWTGEKMEIFSEAGTVTQLIRCAHLCVACDLPAGHKLSGFLGHSAN